MEKPSSGVLPDVTLSDVEGTPAWKEHPLAVLPQNAPREGPTTARHHRRGIEIRGPEGPGPSQTAAEHPVLSSRDLEDGHLAQTRQGGQQIPTLLM